MSMPLPKDRFRNDSGGILGVCVRKRDGVGFTSKSVLPSEYVDLDAHEQQETALAPKDERFNPLANGWLTLIRENMEYVEARPVRYDPNLTANTAAAKGVPSPDGQAPDREPPGRAPGVAPPPPVQVPERPQAGLGGSGEEMPPELLENPAIHEPASVAERETDAAIAARLAALDAQQHAAGEEVATQVADAGAPPTGGFGPTEETGDTPAPQEVDGRDVVRQSPPAAPGQVPRPRAA